MKNKGGKVTKEKLMAVSNRRAEAMFEDWLTQNAGRFYHPPVKVNDAKGHKARWKFTGVTDALEIWPTAHDISVACTFKGQLFDFLLSPDIGPAKIAPGKYLCSICVREYMDLLRNKKPKVFPSIESLYADHLFDPLLAWANKNLRQDKFLGLYGNPPHTNSWAWISSLKKVLGTKDIVHVSPVVLDPLTKSRKAFWVMEYLQIPLPDGRQKRLYVI